MYIQLKVYKDLKLLVFRFFFCKIWVRSKVRLIELSSNGSDYDKQIKLSNFDNILLTWDVNLETAMWMHKLQRLEET